MIYITYTSVFYCFKTDIGQQKVRIKPMTAFFSFKQTAYKIYDSIHCWRHNTQKLALHAKIKEGIWDDMTNFKITTLQRKM